MTLAPIHACAWVSPGGGRHLGLKSSSHLHGGTKDAASAIREQRFARKCAAGSSEATEVSKVRLDRERAEQYIAREPEEAHRSGFGVVKRQVHRSPGHGCKPVGHGRGASLEEMPVAHEARVLVVRQWEAEVGRTHRVRSLAASRKADCRKDELARGSHLAADTADGGL